ncbi:hypothetical protein BJ742DRAFT_558308 [Cladochytrium replicatum]|nr:hypothetical protein BJ742DRAFT_558308 [Cladochytrium replicatum]
MSAFTTSGVVMGIVTCCAVERFLIILTNKKIKWTILGLAIVASAANLTHHVILMWEPTRVALSGPNKTRPTYLPLAVLIATAIPCIVILVTGIGVFSLSLVRHLRQRKEGFTSSSSANGPSADRAIYIVLIVHHAHLISTLAVYVIFGTAIALLHNAWGCCCARLPPAFELRLSAMSNCLWTVRWSGMDRTDVLWRTFRLLSTECILRPRLLNCLAG